MTCSLRRTVIAACALGVLAASAARAAVFIPTKTVDSADGACTPLDCSLREAVLAANATAGDDVILLHAGTYVLTLISGNIPGNLEITDELVVLGDGASRTIIDGGGIDGILYIFGTVDLEIRDVTLRNGRSTGGGAIRNDGNLTVLRCVVAGNTSVPGGGTGVGGGILSSAGHLVVRDSTIANNTAQGTGGGIHADGMVELANVTIAGNRSQDAGGGLFVSSGARMTVNNATIFANTAPRGGGVYSAITPFIGVAPKITNSILAGNSAPTHADCSGIVETGYDLISDGTGCASSPAAHDLVGTFQIPLTVALGALIENGGPTPTHELSVGSLARDGASPAAAGSPGACEATDQRGAVRPGGSRCDFGAFETTDACVPGGPSLCLNGGRFKVTATFQSAGSRPAQAVGLTNGSGYLWFFSPDNVELTTKVLNGCGTNNRYWVFLSGLTNLRVDVIVKDTKTGASKLYTNPQGRVFRTVLDTVAFATCP